MQKAYRGLAKKLHPDLNPGDKAAEEKFKEVAGANKRLTLPGGGTLDVTIPPGLVDGQTLRLKGKGAPGTGKGGPGDALIEVEVLPDRRFAREGDDISLELPVSLSEAVLGGRI